MAPRAVRTGSASSYPEGALEQYEAVASVMAKGRDKRAAMVMLIGRGGLPASATMFRRALRYLFEGAPWTEGDILSFAEQAFADAQDDRDFPRFEKFMKRNAAKTQIIDPTTGSSVPTSVLIESAFVNGFAALMGRQFPNIEAVTEVGTAYGFLGPEIATDERQRRLNYLEACIEDVFNIRALHQTAETVAPNTLQSAILEILRDSDAFLLELKQVFPQGWHDAMIVIFGLGIVAIEELGGDMWFERATAGVT
jgi:hypothetical protein